MRYRENIFGIATLIVLNLLAIILICSISVIKFLYTNNHVSNAMYLVIIIITVFLVSFATLKSYDKLPNFSVCCVTLVIGLMPYETEGARILELLLSSNYTLSDFANFFPLWLAFLFDMLFYLLPTWLIVRYLVYLPAKKQRSRL